MAKVDLVPIKVRIRLGPDGTHAYPAFNQLEPALRGHKDWSVFFDRVGIGWHYDKVSGIGEVDEGNPDPDVWFGGTCVPAAFAEAAAAAFPGDVEIISEAEWETFYEERAHAHEPTEHLDTEVLQGIAARVELEEKGIAPAPSAEIIEARKKCLDPTCETHRGIRVNPAKKWELFKAKAGLSIHPDRAK